MTRRTPDPAVQPALAALRQQAYDVVDRVCAPLLEHEPHRPDVVLIQAQADSERGDRAGAIDRLQRAVAAHPEHPALGVALGQQWLADGALDAADDAFAAVLHHEPDHAGARAGHALVRERRGAWSELIADLAPRVARDAPAPAALIGPLLRAYRATGALDDAIALGESIRQRSERPTMARRDVLFSLARAYEARGGAGDFESAFRTAEAANALLAPRVDPDATDAWVDQQIAYFTAKRVRSFPKLTLRTDDAVFIVGLPRCGSTLLERMLAAHPAIAGLGEIPHFHRVVVGLPAQLGSSRDVPECLSALKEPAARAAARAYLDAIRAVAPDVERRVNKDLGVLRHLGVVAALLPQATVIHCVREPLTHGLACWMERLRPSAAPYATDLEATGRHLRSMERLMAHWHEVLPLRIETVAYEALVRDPEPEVRRVLDALGVPFDAACLTAHTSSRTDHTLSADQVRQPLYQSSVDRAAHYDPWLAPLRRGLGIDESRPHPD